uniref:serine hydrolase n=1 Tax=uncultured Mycolicibacterium sp. TaxID=2320817 RepID=UPI0032B1BFF7
LRIWAPALANGKLLTRQMQEQRLQTVALPGQSPPAGYGLGLFNLGGWIGHNGSLPGYQTVAVYLPAAQTTLVILINTDIPFEGKDPGTLLATAITTELTPEHVYRIE